MSAIDMISKEKFTEFTGFAVYDAESGEPVTPVEYFRSYYDDEDMYVPDDYYFAISYDGTLVVCMPWEGVNKVNKEGKYLIQFCNGMYVRY